MTSSIDNHLVTLDDIQKAQQVIAGRVYLTPTVTAHTLGKMLGVNLFFKAELFQKSGSFKVRGALNKLNSLTEEEKQRGVITISAGNHAAGLSYAASVLGIQMTAVMPQSAMRSKIDATEGYGGAVILHGTGKDLLAKAQEIQQERNLTFIPPFDDPFIIAGQGTVGLELLEDVPVPDVVLVGVGGGGLISGIATVMKLKSPATKVIGVEPFGAPGMTQSLQQNAPAHLDRTDTIADGLAAPFVGKLNLLHVQHYVDGIVLVSDEEIIAAMRLILERCKLLAEPAAAAGFAALLHHKITIPNGATVVCVLSGGNIDRSRLKEIL